MLGRVLTILLTAALLSACGQKGPLVLPEEEARRKPAPPAHDVPPVQERRQ